MIENIKSAYYLVKYSDWTYENNFDKVIFITNKKSTATKYCTKFNKLLKNGRVITSNLKPKNMVL